ncbi:MAG: aldo/keto reductase [SAR202 cluster bacterium]|nr:aldo/keto reductase [SAR202 cluster bacterium]MDP6513821.1 aldo/keto reductase [SAR202 cluster bacterium]MDP6714289.1 aldo/keto reductase [SAR202 cluster bacterium]
MNPLDTAQVGTTALKVTRLGLGGAPLGGLFTDVEVPTALSTVAKGHEVGIRYFDTAPLYGHGKSETYVGQALQAFPRDQFVLSSKVGRVLDPVDRQPDTDTYVALPPFEAVFDYSRDGILRSLEESLQRLGLDRIDIAFIHDPDDHHEQAINEAFPTLADLRSQGVISAIGAGMNQWEALSQFAREGDFDCFLLAGRYTLLDYSGLDDLLPLCEEKQISIMLGGPYNSGILASDLQPGATYFYQEAPADVLDKARQIKSVCDRHDVPLKAAALQFGLAHPAAAATIPGARSPQEVEENIQMASYSIPADLWSELRHEGYLPEYAPVPTD